MTDTRNLQRTPLFELHTALGATMVPFAGYAMPVQYPGGVLREHLHTRRAAGLFDVSHMGQVVIRPKSGAMDDAALALETLVPVDVKALQPGRQRYALFTGPQGGILDDLMIANRGEHFLLVLNAACKKDDLALLRQALEETCFVETLDDRALLALQGPKAGTAVETLVPDIAAMRFMDVRTVELCGVDCIVSRSGYTGEDGFEISVPAESAETLARALLALDPVEPIGLGARDSLRLEAGLCLYGNDIDTTTTPVQAALEWAIQKSRRQEGVRAGGFPGAEEILNELSRGAPRRRVGLRPESRAPVRGGSDLFAEETGGEPVGAVTSGSFGPTLEAPVAMGYVPSELAGSGTRLFAEVRGKRLPVIVASLPFIPPRYKRA